MAPGPPFIGSDIYRSSSCVVALWRAEGEQHIALLTARRFNIGCNVKLRALVARLAVRVHTMPEILVEAL